MKPEIMLSDIAIPRVDVTTWGASYPAYVQGGAAEARGMVVLANGSYFDVTVRLTPEENRELVDLVDRVGRRVLAENGLA